MRTPLTSCHGLVGPLSFLILLLSWAKPSSAAPTSASPAPRCGTTHYPTILQQLVENYPNVVGPNTADTTGTFHVSRAVSIDGVSSSRAAQLVVFTDLPPSSSSSSSATCELSMSFPPKYPMTVHPPGFNRAVQMNVTTISSPEDPPADITYPNTLSWASIGPYRASDPEAGEVFGTVSAVPGTTQVVNSLPCGESLAFLFEIAEWVPYSASVNFAQVNGDLGGDGDELVLAGVYMTSIC